MGISKLFGRISGLAAAAGLAFALLVAPAASAQEKLSIDNEPVMVVTVASINKLMQDVNYLTGAAGQPGAGGMFQMMAATFTQGIDTTKPIGMMLGMVNDTPAPLVFIPTSDVGTVLDRLKAQIGPVDKLNDGTLVMSVGPNTMYIQQADDWAVAAQARDHLKMAPADPSLLFEGMGNNYDIALKIKVQQIPVDMRDTIIGQMRQGFEQAMQQQSAEEADATREMAESSLEQIEQLIQDSDEISFGWNVDPESKNMVMDFEFRAVPDSDMAEMYAGTKAIPSRFASVIRSDAAAYLHAATSISDKAIESARGSIDSAMSAVRGTIAQDGNLSEADAAEINTYIDRVIEIAVSSMEEGKSDFGAMLIASETDLRFVLGMFVSDGNEVATLAQDLAKKIEGQPNAPTFKFNNGKHNGVTLHLVESEVPASEDEARKIFGDTLQIHIGTADNAVYIAGGKDGLKEMKQLIDDGQTDNGTDRPLSQGRFQLLPILKFAQSIDDNDAVTAMINALSSSPDPGEIMVVSEPVEHGSKIRITVGEGLIKALGAAGAAAQNAQF